MLQLSKQAIFLSTEQRKVWCTEVKTNYDYYRVSKYGGWYKQVYLTNFHCLTSDEIYVAPYNFNLTYKIYVTPKIHSDTRSIK